MSFFASKVAVSFILIASVAAGPSIQRTSKVLDRPAKGLSPMAPQIGSVAASLSRLPERQDDVTMHPMGPVRSAAIDRLLPLLWSAVRAPRALPG